VKVVISSRIIGTRIYTPDIINGTTCLPEQMF